MRLKIGEVAQRFQLPVSTLRYYDSQGFFPRMQRVGGQRVFGEREIATLHVIDCLKSSGLSIEEIKQFIHWCEQGDDTLHKRLQLLSDRKKILDEQIKELHRVQAMLIYKTWYYRTAIELGSEEKVRELPAESVPEDIRETRNYAYSAYKKTEIPQK
ncbi:MerR family transcriptional regulator [Schaalia sp. lx-260]|uniref:MerR family transcriptional regulator n=1 Tax=Schaalia sp. lx-260 TaxID=2899082 RepID=UPI001E4D9A26|nr:MerR family transcriptional regulator [Schaalia sp. lx-260]MCD4549597.1 MerR family transcriptional regulator [Schaalia sp. lx-260]